MPAMLSLAEVQQRAAKLCLEASLPTGDLDLLNFLIKLVDVEEWPIPERRPHCLHSLPLFEYHMRRPAADLREALVRMWKAGIVAVYYERGYGYKCIDLSALRPWSDAKG